MAFQENWFKMWREYRRDADRMDARLDELQASMDAGYIRTNEWFRGLQKELSLAREETAEAIAITNELADSVSHVATGMSTLSTDMAKLSTDVAKISVDVTQISTNMTTISTGMATISTNMATISTDMDTVSTDMGTISTDVATISTGMATISTDMATISTGMSEMARDMAELGSKISGLTRVQRRTELRQIASDDQLQGAIDSVNEVRANHSELSRTLRGRLRLFEDRFSKVVAKVDKSLESEFAELRARIEALEKKDSAA